MTEAQRLISVLPTNRQIVLQQMELYAFIHYGICTFTDKEWGSKDDDISVFNPDSLDVKQWVTAVKSANMKGIILTCKHHDGFCLWDTAYTQRSVMYTPFKRDIVKELAQECARRGVKLGIYLSPWDMSCPLYGSGKAYDDYYIAQLTELLSNYGEMFTVWLDGACGEGANGKVQRYDWHRYYDTVRALQPNATIAVTGPDIRWCGNEAGVCRESEFSVVSARLQDPELIAGTSQQSVADADRLKAITRKDADLGSREALADEPELVWYPAEVDTSIRPGWFYHRSDDDKVKSDDTLWQLYQSSVGGNATLLLNIPPDTHGRMHPTDCARLAALGERIRSTFATSLAQEATAYATSEAPEHKAHNIFNMSDSYFMPPSGCESVDIKVKLPYDKTFEYAILMEQIAVSQRIEGYELWVSDSCIYSGTTVGYKKICHFAPVTADNITIRILRSRVAPSIKYFGIF